MRRDKFETDRRRSSSARAVLVALLLVGLLGMHGLGSPAPSHDGAHPGPTHAAGSPASGAAAESGASVAPVPDDRGPRQERVCHGHGGGPGQHSAHADDLCAAGGISGAPALSAPAVSSLSPADPALRPHLPSRYEPEGGRAPPSLAELQLLRI